MPADTFRAWERRYAIPRPGRTSGNQRLYAERDIATISWLRQQTASGMTISQAVALFRRHEQPTTDAPSSPSPFDASAPGGSLDSDQARAELGDASRRLVSALRELDGSRADRIIEEGMAFGSVEGICVDLLQPALQEIGEQWHRGEASVAVEHFASAFVGRKLGALLNHSNPSQGRGPIVAACVAGEQHELGLLATAVLLSRHGFHIVYLGANMPLPDLIGTVESLRPPMVLLSASRLETAETLRAWVAALKRPLDDGTIPVVAFGGGVFASDPAVRRSVDAVYLGHDARDAVANAERIFANLPVVVD